MNRGDRRQDLVPLVLTEQGAKRPYDALLADPLVESGIYRRKMFPDKPALIKDYADIDDRNAVVLFLERLGLCGVNPFKVTSVPKFGPEAVATMLDIDKYHVDRARANRYTVLDYEFPFRLENVSFDALQSWMSLEHAAFRGKGSRSANSFFHGPRFTQGRSGTASWVRSLQTHPWLLCKDGQRRKPADVLLEPDPDCEDAPVAEIDPSLGERLKEEGVEFGSNVRKSPVLRRLSRRGASEMPDTELEELLRKARGLVDSGHATKEELREALNDVRLRGVPMRTRVVRQTGAGKGRRSDLGGWVAALEDVEPSLAAEVIKLPLSIPETTTGRQALDFLLYVWNEKPPHVEEIRRNLAAATDTSWMILPAATCQTKNGAKHVRRHVFTDKAVGTRLARILSWPTFSLRSFAISCRKAGASLSSREDRRELQEILFHDKITLRVGGTEHHINAYVYDGALLLVGTPLEFAADAAQQLVGHFRLGQQGNVVPYLTMAISSLDNEDSFRHNFKILCDGLGVEVPEDASDLAPNEAWARTDEAAPADQSNEDHDAGDQETDHDESERSADNPGPHAATPEDPEAQADA